MADLQAIADPDLQEVIRQCRAEKDTYPRDLQLESLIIILVGTDPDAARLLLTEMTLPEQRLSAYWEIIASTRALSDVEAGLRELEAVTDRGSREPFEGLFMAAREALKGDVVHAFAEAKKLSRSNRQRRLMILIALADSDFVEDGEASRVEVEVTVGRTVSGQNENGVSAVHLILKPTSPKRRRQVFSAEPLERFQALVAAGDKARAAHKAMALADLAEDGDPNDAVRLYEEGGDSFFQHFPTIHEQFWHALTVSFAQLGELPRARMYFAKLTSPPLRAEAAAHLYVAARATV